MHNFYFFIVFDSTNTQVEQVIYCTDAQACTLEDVTGNRTLKVDFAFVKKIYLYGKGVKFSKKVVELAASDLKDN